MTSLRTLRDVKNLEIVNHGDVIPLVMDGVTPNSIFKAQTIMQLKQPPSYTKIAVTLTMGSPGVVNYPGHGLRVGEVVVLYGIDLPTGLVQGKQYFVCYENMTVDTFQLTDTNMWLHFWQSDSYPLNFINFTGTPPSNPVYIAVQGIGWHIVTCPPGTYYSDGNYTGQTFAAGSGQRRSKYYLYGVEGFAVGCPGGNIGVTGYNWLDSGNVDPIFRANRGDNRVQIKDKTRLSKYSPGSWIAVLALNTQDPYGTVGSWPSNASYCEYKRIKYMDFVNGYIYFQDKDSTSPQYLRNSYMDWYPVFGANGQTTGGTNFAYGAACIAPMMTGWDRESEMYGFRSTDLSGLGETGMNGRKTRFVDYIFESQTGKPVPSGSQVCTLENCSGTHLEIDKLVEELHVERCEFQSTECESGATDIYTISRCKIYQMAGTARATVVRDSYIGSMQISPLGFGASDSILLENCRIGAIAEQTRLDQAPYIPSSYGNLLANWTWTGGTLQVPIVNGYGPNSWVVPGRYVQLTDFAQRTYGAAIGGTFRILNNYITGTVETITFNMSTNVVNDASPPANGTMVSFKALTGTLPGVIDRAGGGRANSGILPYTPYYVINSGVGGGYRVSLTSPTEQAFFTNGSPNINWTAFIMGQQVIFSTTGTLPTNFTPGVTYYVIGAGLGYNQYQVSATPNGPAIVAGSAGSGTHFVTAPVVFTGTNTGTYQSLTNLTYNIDTDLGAMPVGDQTNSTVSINIGTGVLTWNNDGTGSTPVNGVPLIFKTTGQLPTFTGYNASNGSTGTLPSTAGGLYFVAQQSGNTFKISSTSDGTHIVAFSGTQSGTHTAVGNPLMLKPVACPRITVKNCYGCPQIVDMSNGPPNMPLNSYINRMFTGFIDPNGGGTYVPDLPLLVGKIQSMIINVIRAETGSPLTVTITIPTYNDDLTKGPNMVQVINLKTTGIRTIPSGGGSPTGSQTGDILAACNRWLCGGMGVAYSTYGSDTQIGQTSKWQIIIQTDQGFYNLPVCHYGPENGYADGGMTLVESDLSSTIGMGKAIIQ